MNAALREAAERFSIRARLVAQEGRTLDSEATERLEVDLAGMLPEWYATLLEELPLCDLAFDLPWPDGDGREPLSLRLNDDEAIRAESLEMEPGMQALPLGYVCIAYDETGKGHSLFLTAQEGDDPPVYLLDRTAPMPVEGRIRVRATLSQVFRDAVLEQVL
jgi:hypothetical protein